VEPVAVHHVSVNVADAAQGVRFYTDVLGGTIREDRPDFGIGGAWIDLGATQVHLIESSVPPNLGQHFAILVDDLDAAVDELRAGGLDVGDPSAVGANRQTFLTDPSGNLIELHELGTPAR
jgi:catechol 2,3-dioxygenase-like lactoylglutathione lyase family enzyme